MERYGEELTIDPDEDKKYRLEVAKDGEAVLVIRNALPTGDLRLNSIYDPAYEAKRWADKQDIRNRRTTIALLGFSTGVFLKALMEKLRPDTVFFVYEPGESLFSFLCAFTDLTDIISDSRVKLYVTDSQRRHYEEDMLHDMSTFRPEAKGIITPFYQTNDEFTGACNAIAKVMESNRNYMRGRSRIALKARMYAWNHIRHASFFPDLKKLIPQGIPAVIVSAGPSLRKNVETLRKIKGRALIICTDRAASVLDEVGIVPDLVASLDAEKSADYLNYKILENVPMIASYQVNIDAQKLFEDRCIFFHALTYENRLFGEAVGKMEQGIDLGGNVAGGSFIACEMLGINTIILIGQDLAFLDGKHHADGKNEGMPDIDAKEIEGIDGKPVLSNDMWIAFKEFYERQMNIHPELTVIDATEGGALIRGSKVMTLEEVAETVCTETYDIDDILAKLPKAVDEEGYKKAREVMNGWLDEIDELIHNSEELEVLCRQLLRVAKYQNINDPKLERKFKKLDDLRKPLYDSVINYMLEEYWIEDMYSIPDYTFMVRNNEEAIPQFETAMKFFGHLPEDLKSLKEELKKAMEV
ncbi:motility associated factor glycosyltransferase family protein [Butyrivibrio sp. WCD2001]|uniref:motility associated factor glycosyltransferase family protein n=1 Tax=Butyrivibrio sp. WCD2001 TaxID=1280681 RepID=UPI0018C90A79|nr:6-hydroxymethylpterin diphosphokinase MptE-like protein [Butyrivibrio sp. WCD2001]